MNALIDLEESKKIQLDILSNVDSFCRKKNIKYSIGYGTLLGAVRHNGFIPWDDDIDICMLREDYNRFIREYSKADTGIYKLIFGPNNLLPFAKVYDKRTVLIHRNAKTRRMGVFIDIFPLDVASKNINCFKRDKKEIKFYKFVVNSKIEKFRPDKSLSRNLWLMVCKIVFSIISLRFIINQWLKSLSKRNNENSFFVADNVAGLFKNPVARNVFEEIIDYDFEGKKFWGVKDADLVLKNIYGDYMQLPPISERCPKHEYKAYWDI